MASLYKDFTGFVSRHGLLQATGTVIAGVSGGVDSMVMLHCLLNYCRENKIELIVAHLNHRIRGSAAEQDEILVKEYCRLNQCKFISKSVNVAEMARKQGLSVEMAGRAARYQFFQDISKNYPGSRIATAHTADDQVETILYRIFKGTGLNGLVGIRIRRDNIIRPLLFARKSEIYDFAKNNRIPFSEDYTNRDTSLPRNFIRNALIPNLKSEINPSLEKAILHLRETFFDLHRLTQSLAEEALKTCLIRQSALEIALDISQLKRYFKTVIFEVVLRSLKSLHQEEFPAIDYHIMTNLLTLLEPGRTGARQKIAGDIYAFRNRNELIIGKINPPSWNKISITPGKSYQTDYFSFATELLDGTEFQPDGANANLEYVDFSKLSRAPLHLRPWKKGDRMIPLGTSHSRKVSDIFIDQKIPFLKKNRIPILTCGDTIVWICGIKLADKFKVKPHTTRILKLDYKERY